MKIQRQLENGMWWDEEKEDRINLFLDQAIEFESWFAEREGREPMDTRQEILDHMTSTGKEVRYGPDWYALIRVPITRPPQPVIEPKMVKCNCGHTCEINLVMSTSRGSSCPDCYDRMSD